MLGRKPKPLATQISEGDPAKRGKNKLRQQMAAEPKPTKGLPLCPRHLRGRARAAWNFWRQELEAMNLDAKPDAMMLEGACVNYARAVEADLVLAADGLEIHETIYDKDGDEVGYRRKAHVLIPVSNQSWNAVRAFCSEFGLSPVSRTRIKIEKPDTGEGDLMAALAGPRERSAAVN
jgi:P27 family predicted phage terminase small subunit